MTKFKAGDKVRITNTLTYNGGVKWQPWLNGHEGEVVTVTEYGEDARGINSGWFNIDSEWADGRGIWDGNAELVEEKTLDDLIEEAKQLIAKTQETVAEYEAAKKLKNSAAGLKVGTHVLAWKEYGYDTEFVKVSIGEWVRLMVSESRGEGVAQLRSDTQIEKMGWKLK